jgi:hypothetical protein
MIDTPIGKIVVNIDNKECCYKWIKLPNQMENFQVDGRYKIVIPFLSHKCNIKCQLKIENNEKYSKNIETGEDLELISIYYKGYKLSIGTQYIEGASYNYIDYGLEMSLPTNFEKEITFVISWIKINDPETDELSTWYMSDPTLLGM